MKKSSLAFIIPIFIFAIFFTSALGIDFTSEDVMTTYTDGINYSDQPFYVEPNEPNPINGSINLYRNGTLLSSTRTRTSQNLSVGIYNYTVITEDPANYYETTFEVYDDSIVSDTNAPQFTLIPADDTQEYNSWNDIMVLNYNFDATDNVGINNWFTNDSNFPINSNGVITLNDGAFLPVGTYPVNVTVNDTSGNMNSTIWTFTITQNTQTISLDFRDDMMMTFYTEGINYSEQPFYIDLAYYENQNISFYRNGTLLTINDYLNFQQNLSVGVYNYTLIRHDPNDYFLDDYYERTFEVYDDSIVSDTTAPQFTVIPADDTQEYNSWDDIMVLTYDFEATDNVGINNWFTNDSNFPINSNGVITLNDGAFLPVGTYPVNVTVNDTSGNMNSTIWTFTITQSSDLCEVYFMDSDQLEMVYSPLDEGTDFTINANCGTSSTIYRNGTEVINGGIQSLSAGTYNFSVFRTDTENYTNIYSENEMVIKAVDNEAPQFDMASSEIGYYNQYFHQSLDFFLNAIDNVDSYNDLTWSLNDSRFSIQELGDPYYFKRIVSNSPLEWENVTINVTVNDTSGNENSTLFTIIINKNPEPFLPFVNGTSDLGYVYPPYYYGDILKINFDHQETSVYLDGVEYDTGYEDYLYLPVGTYNFTKIRNSTLYEHHYNETTIVINPLPGYSQVYNYSSSSSIGDIGLNLQNPFGLELYDGKFYMVDMRNYRIFETYQNGTIIGTFLDYSAQTDGGTPSVTTDGTYMWIGDVSNNMIYKYYYTNKTYTGESVSTGIYDAGGLTNDGTYLYYMDNSPAEVRRLWMNNMTDPDSGSAFISYNVSVINQAYDLDYHNGKIYIMGRAGGEVQEYNSTDASYLGETILTDVYPEASYGFTGIEVNDSNFFILNRDSPRLILANSTGHFDSLIIENLMGDYPSSYGGFTCVDGICYVGHGSSPEIFSYWENNNTLIEKFDLTEYGVLRASRLSNDGNYIYLSDLYGGRIYRFHLNWTYSGFSFDTASGGLNYPTGVYFNGTNYFVGSYYDSAIFIFNNTGGYVGQFSTRSESTKGIYVDEEKLYLLSQGSQSIEVYNLTTQTQSETIYLYEINDTYPNYYINDLTISDNYLKVFGYGDYGSAPVIHSFDAPVSAGDTTAPQFVTIPENVTLEYDDISYMNAVIGSNKFILSDDSGNDSITMTVNDSLFSLQPDDTYPDGYFALQFDSTPTSSGVYLLNITANDTSGNINSILFEVNLTQNTEVLNITFGDVDVPPTEFSNQDGINYSDQPFSVIINSYIGFTLYRNGTQISSGQTVTEQNLSVGVYNFTMIRNDPNNFYVNDYYETTFEVYDDSVGDTTVPQFVTIPADTSIVYGNVWDGVEFFIAHENPNMTYGWETNDSRFDIIAPTADSALLYTNNNLSVGVYAIIVSVTNEYSETNSTIYTLTITQSPETFDVLFDKASPQFYGEDFTVYTDASSEVTLYRNGTEILNNSVQSLDVGYYNFTAVRIDNENYSFTTDTSFFTISKSNSACDVLFDKASPQEEGTTFNVWSNCDSSFTLYRNGVPISNDTLQTLSAGSYNFTVIRDDTENYLNYYQEVSFVMTEVDDGGDDGGSSGGSSSLVTLSRVDIQSPDSVLFEEDGEIEIEIYDNDDKLYDPASLPTINVVENVNVNYELIRNNAGKYQLLFSVPFVEGLDEITFEITVTDGGVTINNEVKVGVSESTALQNFVKTVPEKTNSFGSWIGSNLEKILVGVVAIVLIVLTFIFSGRKP